MPTPFFPHTVPSRRRTRVSPQSPHSPDNPRQNSPSLFRLLTIHFCRQFAIWRVGCSLILPILISCGGYSMHEVRLAIERGEFETALTHLDKEDSKKRNLPCLSNEASLPTMQIALRKAIRNLNAPRLSPRIFTRKASPGRLHRF